MDNKFDFVYYSIYPEEWSSVKIDIEKQINDSIEFKKRIEKIILFEDKNKLNRICFDLLFWESFKHNRLASISSKIDHLTGKCSISIDMKILVEGQFIQHKFLAEYRQGKNDFVNIKIENFEKIKNMLLALYSDLNCFIGQQTGLISITDLLILKFQGKSLNKEFLHLTDAEFLKESKKLKDYRIPYYYNYDSIYINKSYTKKEKELALNFEIDKIGTWLFAFLILAYRNKDNSHFINLFKKFDINDLNCLKDCFETFNNGFKEWRKKSKG